MGSDMNKKLVIVESPAKAKTIGKILGKDYIIRASMGHIRDLPEHAFGVDIEHGFSPQYEENKSRSKNLTELKSAAKAAGEIYLASDPDREGEAIAWHLREVLWDAAEWKGARDRHADRTHRRPDAGRTRHAAFDARIPYWRARNRL